MNGKLWSLRLGPVEVVNLLAVFFSGKSGHVCEVVSRSGDGVDGLHRGPRVGLHRRDPESGGHQRSLQRFPGNTFYSLPKEKLQILLQMSPSSFCFNFILHSLFTRIFEQHSHCFFQVHITDAERMEQWSNRWIAILKDAGSTPYGDLPGSSSSPADSALKSLITAMGSKRASNPK